MFGPLGVDAAGYAPGQVHLGHSRLDRAVGLQDGTVRDSGQPAQKVQLTRLFLHPQLRQHPLRRLETCPRQVVDEAIEIPGRQVVHLDANASAGKAAIDQELSQRRHRIVREFSPHPNLASRDVATNRRFLHVHHHHCGM